MDADPTGTADPPELPPASAALLPPPLRRFRSDALTNEALATENVYLGPLGERLISAFRNTSSIPVIMEEMMQKLSEKTLEQDKEEATEEAAISGVSMQPPTPMVDGGRFTSPNLLTPSSFSLDQQGATPSIREMDAVDFEARLTRELAFLGVIPLPTRPPQPAPPASTSLKKPSEPVSSKDNPTSSLVDSSSSVDWSAREDDEIAASLRACQRLLRQQVHINDTRKARLAERVRDRIAYQEYEHLRDGLEAVVEGAWNKRQRAAQRKAYKEKKEKDKKEKDKDKEAAANLAHSIAALNSPQPLSASLVAALTKRRNLVDGISHLFPEGGLVLPQTSIYEDLDLQENVVQLPPEMMST